MRMLEHRLQILLDDARHQRLTQAARERRVSVATIVREAIDRGLATAAPRRRAAGDTLLAAEPVPVPDVPELLTELAELRGRRR
jgi:hypothetical protein